MTFCQLGRSLFGIVVLTLLALAPRALAQPGPDSEHRKDMQLFHYLLDHRQDITRKVTNLNDGVETVTESAKPEIAAKIQEHVEAMYKRLKEGRPIHMRDPLFAEVFRHHEMITFTMEKTKNGIKVKETSKNPYVVKLIQAHAEVVNKFLANGRFEMRKNHEVPPRPMPK